MIDEANQSEGNVVDPLSSAVVENFSESLSLFINQSPDQPFDSTENSSLVCALSDSGLECRVCGSSDGKTSTSTIGVLLCMSIFVAWTYVGKRRAKRRRMAPQMVNPSDVGRAED